MMEFIRELISKRLIEVRVRETHITEQMDRSRDTIKVSTKCNMLPGGN